MWKIALAFIVFAGLALFVIMKGGDKIDMAGEQHGAEAAHMSAPAASAPAPAPTPAPAASAAEPAASAAK
jgi:hypothetical protein